MLINKYNEIIRREKVEFLEKYFNTETMQRLKGKGFFCGMDYVGIPAMRPREYYSRLDHSINVGYSGWNLSSDTATALAGTFHDVGSLSFSHVNSFKKGQGLAQNNDELNVKTVLMQDEELMTFLQQDKINIDDIADYSKYPLLDNEIPSLCLDRVDGILATCLIWTGTHKVKQIEELYKMLCYFENLNGMNYDLSSDRLRDFKGEIVLSEHYVSADYEDFFKAINVYSSILLSKESRYLMHVCGLVLKFYEDKKIFNESDLFYKSEQEIIDRMLDSKYKDVWKDFISVDKVNYADSTQYSDLIVYSKPKIRQANPLCMGQMEVCEIHNISGDFYHELNDLSEAIELVSKPLIGNLNGRTAKVLSRYNK